MAAIKEIKNAIVLENDYAEISLSKKTSLVEKVIDKKTGKDIRGDETQFFTLFASKEEESVAVTGISLKGNVITVATEKGSFEVKAEALDHYFTFEIISELPEGIYKAYIAYVKYDYDYLDKKNTAAVTIPITIWVDPLYYPDGKSRETIGRIYPHLGVKGAKLGLIIAPVIEHRDLIKEVTLTIDKNTGIRSTTGGAWGRDSRLNFSNYTIQSETTREFIDSNIDYFKSIGVDQIDLHQGAATFRQGDFKFMRYKDGAEFKKNVSDVLEANGMAAGLHSYSFYIAYNCDTLLSKPENLRQLMIMGKYTLADDISADDMFIALEEGTADIPTDRGFCRTNSPFVLIGDELICFDITKDGLKITQRGAAGTKAVAHKKGEAVKHITGHYHGLVPEFGSELFLEVARNTGKAYTEGGFKMIYLDALDGIHYHCDNKNEAWFYMAQFVCEVLKYCKVDPVLEGASFMPSMYAARGRIGAWDTPYRGYRNWNLRHTNSNKVFIDRYSAPILGWYNYYPMTDAYPANEHTKYHHTDSIEHMGMLAVMYDFSNVFNGLSKGQLERYAGMRRNIALYKKYDDLRKAQYFSEDYRQKLIDGPYEYHLKEKRGGKWTFVEKDYQVAKLFDLSDPDRNVGHFKNPFGAQVPFVRIEAMHSTLYQNPMVMMKLDENQDLMSQKLSVKYGTEINFKENLAKTVKVFGNGLGGKIAIKTRCATNSEMGYGEYIVDVNFKGWREFILIESDNGERNDHHFEDKENLYAIFRSSLNNDRTTGVDIETEGDMTGVKMSSIIAYEHVHEVYKNPTLKLGDTWVVFECELLSGEFIEWDGKTAKTIDRFGNERPIWFNNDGNFKAPRGKFNVSVEARALNRTTPRMQLTLGFTGKEVK
ncbi:MAG: hypothetical protein IJ323_07090 [Clostridia bacterium]|nr:hypothetical protein [Clostridia bacterium]